MNQTEITTILESLRANTSTIQDGSIKASIEILLNLVEALASENQALKIENQQLKDKINRLKGEQGKPNIKGKNNQSKDISSEKERSKLNPPKNKKQRNRDSKLDKIIVNRSQICPVCKDDLPEDAVPKGHQSVFVQDIKIVTDNVEYKREVYYSASEKKTYLGPLPKEVEGEFGAGVRSLIIAMKYVCNMSQPKILEFLENMGIYISKAYISNFLTHKQDIFHVEKEALYLAGLASGSYQQIDDTSARVKGKNHYNQVMCNQYYTAYFTTERKDRLTVLDVLRNFSPRTFIFNEQTMELLSDSFHLAKKIILQVDAFEKDRILNQDEMNGMLKSIHNLGKNQQTRIIEAAAIAAYQKETGLPKVTLLLCDNAPQFKLLTEELALCWVHDGRHYKKLNPIVPEHQTKLEAFLEQYWDFYAKLLVFKAAPDSATAKLLSLEFDRLFSTQTRYEQLDERIAKTKNKKTALMLVLRYPELPLHNNAAELGARAQARMRDVSLHTVSDAGTKSKDTFMTIVETAKKLGVNAYEYIYDRVSKAFKLPSLATVIEQRSQNELAT